MLIEITPSILQNLDPDDKVGRCGRVSKFGTVYFIGRRDLKEGPTYIIWASVMTGLRFVERHYTSKDATSALRRISKECK
jgi:hypothetical protein